MSVVEIENMGTLSAILKRLFGLSHDPEYAYTEGESWVGMAVQMGELVQNLAINPADIAGDYPHTESWHSEQRNYITIASCVLIMAWLRKGDAVFDLLANGMVTTAPSVVIGPDSDVQLSMMVLVKKLSEKVNAAIEGSLEGAIDALVILNMLLMVRAELTLDQFIACAIPEESEQA